MMLRTVHLVTDSADAAHALQHAQARDHIVALEHPARTFLVDRGVEHGVADDYLEDERFFEVTKVGFDWSQRWYGDPALAHLLNVEGVSLALAAEHVFYYYFIAALRAVDIFLAILERERPSRVLTYTKPSRPPRAVLVQQDEPFFARVFEQLAGLQTWPCPVDVVAAPPPDRGRLARPSRGFRQAVRAVARASLAKLSNAWEGNARAYGRAAGPRVGFLAPDGGLNKFYAPILREIRRRGTCVPVFVSDGISASPRLGISSLDVQRLVPLEAKVAVARQLDRARPLALDRAAETFVYRGVRLDGIVRDRIEFAFATLFPWLATVVQGIGLALRECRVDVIVTPNEIREFYRACLLAARAHGTPSLVILHGVPTKKHPYFPGFEPRFADRMAVWGQACSEVLGEQGLDVQKLVMTGNPLFDWPPGPLNTANRAQILKKLGLLPDRKVVSFPSDRRNKGVQAYDITLSLREREELFITVIDAVNRIPEAQLVIKASPGDFDVPYIQKLVHRHATNHTVVVQHADLYELLSVTDVVVTNHSTVGLEALWCGALLVIANFTGRPDRIDYAKHGVAIGVYEEAGLADALRRALFSAEVREELRRAIPDFLAAYAGPLDGRSAERVLALINEMAATRSTQPSGRVRASKNGKNRKAP